MLPTSFGNLQQVYLTPWLSVHVPKDLSISRRSLVLDNFGVEISWWAWGGCLIATDFGCKSRDDYIEVNVTALEIRVKSKEVF